MKKTGIIAIISLAGVLCIDLAFAPLQTCSTFSTPEIVSRFYADENTLRDFAEKTFLPSCALQSFRSRRTSPLYISDSHGIRRNLAGAFSQNDQTSESFLFRRPEQTNFSREKKSHLLASATLKDAPMRQNQDILRWNRISMRYEIDPDARDDFRKTIRNTLIALNFSQKTRAKAEKYLLSAIHWGDIYQVSPDLMLAMIHTESDFNPTLVSRKSAHGLMQIVPETAGDEVHQWLGYSQPLTSDRLFHPDTNIRYGAAYFRLLQKRYLQDIRNPVSREYCAIAAYNGGTAPLMRTFAASPREAIRKINGMSSQKVLEKLRRDMPYAETRRYMNRVLASKERFSCLLPLSKTVPFDGNVKPIRIADQEMIS
ncbi:MAG: transglycosylase SLT domain-containing protein [Desulfovibrionaceae bacterium]|nr:transglycosylase SLT domain-containing protein [Desulfovibrionaceae bacterium]